ncbi:MAG: type II secretion system minor pseudopilin GspK [Spirochaetota bacterium]
MFLSQRCKGLFRAFALISVLVLVAVLSTIALEFSRRSGIGLRMAINYADSKKAYFYAFGGYKAALALLMTDRNNYDGIGDPWYGGLPTIPIDNGSIVVTIEDEKARYNVKKLITDYGIEDRRRRSMLERIFQFLEIEPELIDGITDWQDSDDYPMPMGAESQYYNSQTPPYEPRNAPILTLGELILVRDVTRELYFMPPSRLSQSVQNELQPLSHYLTVYGDGMININTAELPILIGLSKDIDRSIAEDIISYREAQAFEKPEDLKNVDSITDSLYDEIASLITVRSDLFRITSSGKCGEFICTITAVVLRGSRGVRVVYFSRSL